MKKVLLSLLAVAAIGLWAFNFTPSAEGNKGLDPGDKAVEFKLKNVDGKMVSLAETVQKNKGAIVVFTCNHCPFSVLYEDRIIALDKKYKSKGYPVIAVNPNDPNIQPEDSFDNMVKRAKEKKFGFPYLVDETQEIAKAYGATRTPHVFVVNKKGNDMIVSYIGAIDDEAEDAKKASKKFVETAIDELLANKSTLTYTKEKAVGCGIKWRKS